MGCGLVFPVCNGCCVVQSVHLSDNWSHPSHGLDSVLSVCMKEGVDEAGFPWKERYSWCFSVYLPIMVKDCVFRPSGISLLQGTPDKWHSLYVFRQCAERWMYFPTELQGWVSVSRYILLRETWLTWIRNAWIGYSLTRDLFERMAIRI